MLNIINKGLPNAVLSKHLRLIWKEAKYERSVWIEEYRAKMLPNVGIAYVSGMISVRANREYIAENRGGWTDNITQDRTCPGCMERGDEICTHIHTHTHDTD